MSKNSIQTFAQRHSAERNRLLIIDHEISLSGKLLSKTESCAGKITKAKYTYDKQGRLIQESQTIDQISFHRFSSGFFLC